MRMLSNKSAKILIAAERHMIHKGWWPTLKELSELVGISPNAVRDHLQRMVKYGVITPNLDSHAGSYRFTDSTDAGGQS